MTSVADASAMSDASVAASLQAIGNGWAQDEKTYQAINATTSQGIQAITLAMIASADSAIKVLHDENNENRAGLDKSRQGSEATLVQLA